jgi:hypothetical protein
VRNRPPSILLILLQECLVIRRTHWQQVVAVFLHSSPLAGGSTPPPGFPKNSPVQGPSSSYPILPHRKRSVNPRSSPRHLPKEIPGPDPTTTDCGGPAHGHLTSPEDPIDHPRAQVPASRIYSPKRGAYGPTLGGPTKSRCVHPICIPNAGGQEDPPVVGVRGLRPDIGKSRSKAQNQRQDQRPTTGVRGLRFDVGKRGGGRARAEPARVPRNLEPAQGEPRTRPWTKECCRVPRYQNGVRVCAGSERTRPRTAAQARSQATLDRTQNP